MPRLLPYLITCCCAAVLFLTACQRDEQFITDGDVRLGFSLDTIRFDTVFTQLGSATQILKVYNTYDQSVRIDRIRLSGDAASKFRINVDGLAGNDQMAVRILPQDSIYVFAEVTIDPDEDLSTSPFIINEELIFETNGNEQRVVLEAFGQNANYLPGRFFRDSIAIYSGDRIFDDPKPYVFYGVVGLQNGTWTFPAGTEVYVHGGVVAREFNPGEGLSIYNGGLLLVLEGGRLDVRGTREEPVVFRTDRLEPGFAELPNQWAGIRLFSTDNHIEHAVIQNSQVGLFVDSAAELSIKNTVIRYTGGPGLVGVHAAIDGENLLVYDNGGRSLQLAHGGDYRFDHCTFVNYGVEASAVSINNFACYDPPLCNVVDLNPLRARLRNSILFGSSRDELSLFDLSGVDGPDDFDLDLIDCIVRLDDVLDPNEAAFIPDFFDRFCDNCVNGNAQDPLFTAPSDLDYSLDTLSIAQGIAAPLNGLALDLIGTERDPVAPDAGALERIE